MDGIVATSSTLRYTAAAPGALGSAVILSSSSVGCWNWARRRAGDVMAKSSGRWRTKAEIRMGLSFSCS